MKIGAQLYSVREFTKTPEDIRETFRKISEMGYREVHASAIGEIDPYELRDISQEFSLPITVTHTPASKLRENLPKVIEDHKIFGCDVIGFGMIPPVYRDGTFESFKKFYDEFYDISRRIEDAGLKFAYHNHDVEFKVLDNGRTMFDFLAEENENWDIIADICWIRYAGEDIASTLRRIKGRIRNAHLKDIENFNAKDFCALGEGIVDVLGAIPVLEECGCEFAHVEQDNACTKPDAFDEMRRSIEFLKKNGVTE